MCFPSPTIAGTAEPLRVSPPEAVVYPGEIILLRMADSSRIVGSNTVDF
jgi:hypothetical protein